MPVYAATSVTDYVALDACFVEEWVVINLKALQTTNAGSTFPSVR